MLGHRERLWLRVSAITYKLGLVRCTGLRKEGKDGQIHTAD